MEDAIYYIIKTIWFFICLWVMWWLVGESLLADDDGLGPRCGILLLSSLLWYVSWECFVTAWDSRSQK